MDCEDDVTAAAVVENRVAGTGLCLLLDIERITDVKLLQPARSFVHPGTELFQSYRFVASNR